MSTKSLTICAFCPAKACEGLTAIAACEAHWDGPEREAGRLEDDNRRLRGALEQVQTNLVQCRQHRRVWWSTEGKEAIPAFCVHEQDALKIANEALIAYGMAALRVDCCACRRPGGRGEGEDRRPCDCECHETD